MSENITLVVDAAEWDYTGCEFDLKNLSKFEIVNVVENENGSYSIEIEDKISSESKESTETTHNNAMFQLFCEMDDWFERENCSIDPDSSFHHSIKSLIAQQKHS